MNPEIDNKSRGFTLIEILVALVIVSVGVMALGSFGVSILGSGQVARERLTAVHLAEQVVEFWQNNAADRPPNIASNTCALSKRTSDPSSYPVTVSCTPDAGIGISYTIIVNAATAQAPLPTTPGHSFSPIDNTGTAGIRDMVGAVTPMTKVVTVNWSNKGRSHTIYLTHITRMP